MKSIKSQDLIDRLKADTRQVILQTNLLLQKDPEILTIAPGPGKWSIAQIIEHLNSYGRYYLPEIENAIIKSTTKSVDLFTAGWLGDYFVKSMLPKDGNRVSNKMNAPKNHRPSADLDSKTVIDEFLSQQQRLLALLDKAERVHLEKNRVPISIARFVRIKLGDTFRFLIAHHQRHFVQAHNTLEAVKAGNEFVGYTA